MDISSLLGGMEIVESSLTAEHFYSKSNNAFFTHSLHENLPEDCVQVPQEVYFELISKVNTGYELQSDDAGNPTAVKVEIPLDSVKFNIKLDIDNVVTAKALELGFLSFMDALTYIGDPDTDKSAKATALRSWRHAVWKTYADVIEPLITAETTSEEVIPMLPAFEG